jgi:Family of unknown function (DUF6879)
MERVTGEYRDTLIAGFRREALHLELRDVYAGADHGRFMKWLAGEGLDPRQEAQWWRPWQEMMSRHREAGRTLRRLRVVSEPVTEYVKFEFLDAAQLVRAGEDVRWLPRQRASALLLPGNDLWCFDAETVVFTYLSGNGEVQGYELTPDPGLIRQVLAAFEAAWAVAVPHGDYYPRS